MLTPFNPSKNMYSYKLVLTPASSKTASVHDVGSDSPRQHSWRFHMGGIDYKPHL